MLPSSNVHREAKLGGHVLGHVGQVSPESMEAFSMQCYAVGAVCVRIWCMQGRRGRSYESSITRSSQEYVDVLEDGCAGVNTAVSNISSHRVSSAAFACTAAVAGCQQQCIS